MAINSSAQTSFGTDVWDGAPNNDPPGLRVKEIIHDPTGEHIYNVPAVDHLYNKLSARLASVENIGEYLGSFQYYMTDAGTPGGATILPTNVSGFPGRTVNVNDFVTVEHNNTPGNVASGQPATAYGAQVRYVVESVDGSGNITWKYDITYNTDVTGKQNKADVSGLTDTRIAVFEPGGAGGNGDSVPSDINLADIITRDNAQKISERTRAELSDQIGGTKGLVLSPRINIDSVVYSYLNGEWTVGTVTAQTPLNNGSFSEWATGMSYSVGSLVITNSDVITFFRAKVAHTSNSINTPGGGGGGAYWELIGEFAGNNAMMFELLSGAIPLFMSTVTTIAKGGSDDIADIIDKLAISIKVPDNLATAIGNSVYITYSAASPAQVPVIGTVVFGGNQRIGRVIGFIQPPSGTTVYPIVTTVAIIGDTWTSIPLVV
jgi:hypothetical protein